MTAVVDRSVPLDHLLVLFEVKWCLPESFDHLEQCYQRVLMINAGEFPRHLQYDNINTLLRNREGRKCSQNTRSSEAASK